MDTDYALEVEMSCTYVQHIIKYLPVTRPVAGSHVPINLVHLRPDLFATLTQLDDFLVLFRTASLCGMT